MDTAGGPDGKDPLAVPASSSPPGALAAAPPTKAAVLGLRARDAYVPDVSSEVKFGPEDGELQGRIGKHTALL